MRQANRNRKAAAVKGASQLRFVANGRKWKNGYSTVQKCKQAHPGRACDYDEKCECAETVGVNEVAQPRNQPSKDK
jgi:hypothetical protein